MNHYLIYHGEVTPQGCRNLEYLITQAVQNGATSATVCICSHGGDVASGIGAYNFMKMQPIQVRTYAFGICGSIAATMFMAGNERISATVNSFSLHAASYSDGPRIGQISENTSLISMPFRTISDWNKEMVDKYFGSTESKYVTAEDALKLRVATKIQDIIFDRVEPVTHVAIPDQKLSQEPPRPIARPLSELMNSSTFSMTASIPAARGYR